MQQALENAPVLIVGAGPTGLLLAVELRRRNIPVNVVDKHTTPVTWERATIVQPRAAEIFDALGLGKALRENGHETRGVHLFARGEELGYLDFRVPHTHFPFWITIPEERTEAILEEELERLGGRVNRGMTFVELDQRAESVVVTLQDAQGQRQRVETSWVVGADGVHSAVRAAINVAFQGHSYELPWAVIGGVIEDWKHPSEHSAVQLELPCVNPIPMPNGRWRIYYRPPSETGDLIEPVQRGLDVLCPGARLVADEPPVAFRTHRRLAERYRCGRVILAGDAAHCCSPIQGHGMCTGLADSQNLGWKLAMVVRGVVGETLLDDFERERRPVAERVGASGDLAETRGRQLSPEEFDALTGQMSSVLASAEMAAELVWGASELGFTARQPDTQGQCALVGPDEPLEPGDRMPNLDLLRDHSGNLVSLHGLLRGPNFTLITADDGGARFASSLTGLLKKLRVEVDVIVLSGRARAESGWLFLDDGERLCRRRLGLEPGKALLVRPDLLLAARLVLDEPDRTSPVLGAVSPMRNDLLFS